MQCIDCKEEMRLVNKNEFYEFYVCTCGTKARITRPAENQKKEESDG